MFQVSGNSLLIFTVSSNILSCGYIWRGGHSAEKTSFEQDSPLRETHCLFLGSVTRRLLNVFLYSDNFSLISYFKAKEGIDEYFTLCTVFVNVISLIYEKNAAKRTRQHARIVFHQRSSSTEGRLPPQVVFHQRLSSTESRLPLKVIFHQRSSSTKGRPPTQVVFHRRSSSTKVHLPPTITPWFILYL